MFEKYTDFVTIILNMKQLDGGLISVFIFLFRKGQLNYCSSVRKMGDARPFHC
jgi:hypothetical protein